MRRFAFALFVVTMAFSTSGLLDLAVAEPCAINEAPAQEDRDCAATCVLCHCGARSIEVSSPRLVTVRVPVFIEAVPSFELVPTGNPSEILHVPKLATA